MTRNEKEDRRRAQKAASRQWGYPRNPKPQRGNWHRPMRTLSMRGKITVLAGGGIVAGFGLWLSW